jgi:hypothetical protein
MTAIRAQLLEMMKAVASALGEDLSVEIGRYNARLRVKPQTWAFATGLDYRGRMLFGSSPWLA